jgi:hypothetical protein
MTTKPPPTRIDSAGAERPVFLANLHYFYAQTDGSYKWPIGSPGALLKQAKKEIEAQSAAVAKVLAAWDRFNANMDAWGEADAAIEELRALHQADDNE